MKKAKFWMCQIVMVAIVGLVLGSPALAHNDNDDDGFDDYKWHEKFEKKFGKKYAKLYDKLSDKKPAKYARKHAKLEKKYEKKLAKHYRKHPEVHPTGGVSTFVPAPEPEPTCVDTIQRVNGAFMTVCL
ncbi:MAG: hypothetical protein V3R23_03160 [Nitrospinaceae bacterium]